MILVLNSTGFALIIAATMSAAANMLSFPRPHVLFGTWPVKTSDTAVLWRIVRI